MSQKYLYITEEGPLFTGDIFTEAEQIACGDGILEVIDLDEKKIWIDGEWTPLLDWDE